MKLHPYPQLRSNLASRGSDCGPRSVLGLLNAASGGAIDPQGRKDRDVVTASLREDAAPLSIPPATTLTELERAFESWPELPGMTPFLMRKLNPGTLADDVMPALRHGAAALIGVRYSVVNLLAPKLSGARTFDGGHWIVAANPVRRADGVTTVEVMDPTRDVLVRWPLWLLRQASAAFGKTPVGKGNVVAGIVRPVRKVGTPKPPPPPLPDPTCAEQLAEALDQVAAMTARIDELAPLASYATAVLAIARPK